MSSSLIDEVFNNSGFAYISDLHCCKDNQKIVAAIKRVSSQHYSKEEWSELASYITGQIIACENIGETRQYLLDLLVSDL